MPSSWRLDINHRAILPQFHNSPDDIEVRPGDSIYILNRPGFVTVIGQVYNSNAMTFEPGKSARWYLQRAGGATRLANKGDIFIIRASGAVVSGTRSL